MIVLAIAGHQDEGKTSSIRMTAKTLLQQWGQAKIKNFSELSIPADGEFQRLILLNNALKICICSEGDYEDAAISNFKYAHDNYCDIMIVAVRVKRGSIPEYFYAKLNTETDSLVVLSTVYRPNICASNQKEIAEEKFEKLHEVSAHNILWVLHHILQTEFQCSDDYLDFV